MKRSFFVAVVSASLMVGACAKKSKAVEEPVAEASGSGAASAPSQATLDTLAANFQKVHFDTDQATLDAASQAALGENATLLKAYPTVVVEIQGHADERGTTDYNLALGEKRAAAVRSFLVGQGVASGALRTVSFGEERPAATGSGASIWAENRRAEFRLLVGDEGVSGTVP